MRIYTLNEARLLLPEVEPVVLQMQRAAREIRAIRAAAAQAARGASGDGNLLADPWTESGADPLDTLSVSIQQASAQLEAWGIELKDPERGLIDFYWRRDGELVYLCWHLGEDEIRYWHTLTAGFAGRQPI
ncbi:MAG: DUF2203 domain-containing protein [Dehalococcoidia bacterium]